MHSQCRWNTRGKNKLGGTRLWYHSRCNLRMRYRTGKGRNTSTRERRRLSFLDACLLHLQFLLPLYFAPKLEPASLSTRISSWAKSCSTAFWLKLEHEPTTSQDNYFDDFHWRYVPCLLDPCIYFARSKRVPFCLVYQNVLRYFHSWVELNVLTKW